MAIKDNSKVLDKLKQLKLERQGLGKGYWFYIKLKMSQFLWKICFPISNSRIPYINKWATNYVYKGVNLDDNDCSEVSISKDTREKVNKIVEEMKNDHVVFWKKFKERLKSD